MPGGVRKKQQADAPPPWDGRPLAVLRDGPRGRRWYFEDDVERMRAAARAMGRTWPYERTDEVERHPTEPGGRGRVWQYVPYLDR